MKTVYHKAMVYWNHTKRLFFFIIGVILVLIALLFFLRFFIGGPEDSWICNEKGQWIKHGNPSYPKPVASCIKTRLPRTKEDCLKIDGSVWKKMGIDPFETCNIKAKDRGNLCRDSSECEGTCQLNLSYEELKQGMKGKLSVNRQYGQCSVWVVELGCRGIMKNGKAQVICMD